ncbi:MAG: hypothetical protein ABSB49_17380, partial [Polyangia bacterium]
MIQAFRRPSLRIVMAPLKAITCTVVLDKQDAQARKAVFMVGGVDPIWWTVSLRCFLHGLYQLEFDRAVVIERRVAAARVVE